MSHDNGSHYLGLELEISKFRAYANANSAFGELKLVSQDILKFTPKTATLKNLKVGLLSLIHGDEIIGLPILNSIIQSLLEGMIQVNCEIIFGLGNIPAALAGKRFLNKDLNRCFGQQANDLPEDQRARAIEQFILNEVDYLVDIHQTSTSSAAPFFIFEYSSAKCFSHLRLINSKYPTILQFDTIGETKGFSTDEYLRERGRFGVTFELGLLGFNYENFEAGLNTCLQFLKNLNSVNSYEEMNVPFKGQLPFSIFGITDRIVAQDEQSILVNSSYNFLSVEKGDRLGHSKTENIVAPNAGKLLFPKTNQYAKKGESLCFLCTELNPEKNLHLNFDL